MKIHHQKVSKAYGDDCALMFDMHNCLADRLSNKWNWYWNEIFIVFSYELYFMMIECWNYWKGLRSLTNNLVHLHLRWEVTSNEKYNIKILIKNEHWN